MKYEVVVMDLDGTLIREEKAFRMYKMAYDETLRELEKRGISVPSECKPHSYQNFREMSKRIKEFFEIFLKKYEEIFNSFKSEIEEEKERAKKIYEYFVLNGAREIWILTANPKAKEIVKLILPNVPENRVVIVGIDYEEEKQKFLERFKGKALYVADVEELDGKVAEKAGVKFVNVREIERKLFEKI
jgi:phosphoglycolate phosphatase-like HAD superfamily hydrolase